jgi:sugar lactone lactonase YvrE
MKPSLAVLAVVVFSACPTNPPSVDGGTDAGVDGGSSGPAARVLGQPNASENLNLELGIGPLGVELKNGKLIAGSYSWRVLIWNALPSGPTVKPDVVVGQTARANLDEANPVDAVNINPTYFCESVGTDGTRLFLADGYRDRALVWSSIPTTSGAAASVVLGQPNFTTASASAAPPTSQTLSRPCSMFSDGTRLYLADFMNNRVLIWTSLPTSSNVPANLVLGQPSMTVNQPNNGGASASTLNQPTSVWSNGTRLIVSDSGNHRVLVWNSIPTMNQQAADVAIGQPDLLTVTGGAGDVRANTLNSPRRVASDGTRLFVVDHGHNRVLIWNTIPTVSGVSADVVLGQPNFTSLMANHGATGPDDKSLHTPLGLATDGTRLIVGDSGNGRLMIWDAIPTTSDAAASRVWGRPTFTAPTVRGSYDATLKGGGHTFFDGTRLVVSRDRTLIFTGLPSSDGAAADRVLSSATFAEGPPAFTDVRAATHGVVRGVWGDSTRLALADTFHHRVLIWNRPITQNGQGADLVLGQIDFTSSGSNAGGVSERSLRGPNGISSDGTALAVADAANNRVLVWSQFPTVSQQPATTVLGQPNFTSNTPGTLNRPTAVLIAGGKLYVSDHANHRVFVWSSLPTTNGTMPDAVLGQADFSSSAPNGGGAVSATSLNGPEGLAVVGDRLYVADNANHRVLGYALPVSTHAAATWVFGQPGFTTNDINHAGLSEKSLASPTSLSAANGALLVHDSYNDRVVVVTP